MPTQMLRRPKPKKLPSRARGPMEVVVFQTELGWIGIAHVGQQICGVKFGYPSERQLLAQFQGPYHVNQKPNLFERELIEAFSRFAAGEEVCFDDLEIDESGMTPFQQSVSQACRSIPFGETVSYGELAKIAGSPKAARAVGSVMANNAFPLIVPCHRVISSGRRLGGFSAPNGLTLKIQLLQMEGAEGFGSSDDSI